MPDYDSDRAARASRALDYYAQKHEEPDDRRAVFNDLLSDMFHLAAQDGIDMKTALTVAECNFETEREEDEDEHPLDRAAREHQEDQSAGLEGMPNYQA